MSALNHLFDLPEQICYVQCGFCTTILLVSVPCSSMSMVVTVRCGHCTSLLSVNMMKASFVPLHLLASLSTTRNDDHEAKEEVFKEEEEEEEEEGEADQKKVFNRFSPSIFTFSDNEEAEDTVCLINHVVNKPPEKRQRAPSAYNRFIKEEIRRLKTENPKMAHKEAFSTAAKNWAQFPPIQHKGDGESYTGGGHHHQEQEEEGENQTWNFEATVTTTDDHLLVHAEGKGFRERKAPRHS